VVPEVNLMKRDPKSEHVKHSAGKCLNQAPPPEYWQNFNTSNVGRGIAATVSDDDGTVADDVDMGK
jgi:hypothetical protein